MDVTLRNIEMGNKYPYDASDAWNQKESDEREALPPADFAHSAARGILFDLCDRHTIKRGFYNVDEAVRFEIVETLAKIIRAAAIEEMFPKHELDVTAAVFDVIRERRRQVNVKGYGPGHDDRYHRGELARAAAVYALNAAMHGWTEKWLKFYNWVWPWKNSHFKPRTPRRSLVKAAALCIAEIERIDRKEHAEEVNLHTGVNPSKA